MTQEEFTMEQICEYAKDNAEGIILATISYLNSKAVDTDEWIAHVGEKFAPGWDSMKDENVLEVGREAALNWISCGANLVSLSGDDTYAEAILEWPSEDSATYFGISEDDGHKINQAVEKVDIGWILVLENSDLSQEKSILRLCLINLFRFCPAAVITPSMFTFIKRLNRKRLNR